MQNLLFYLALTIIAISLFALTVGQWLPVEFADMKTQFTFYEILFYGFPLAILLTLTGTFKMKNRKSKNAAIIALTIVFAISSFLLWS